VQTEKYRHLRITFSEICDHRPTYRMPADRAWKEIYSKLRRDGFDFKLPVCVSHSWIDVIFSQPLNPADGFDNLPGDVCKPDERGRW